MRKLVAGTGLLAALAVVGGMSYWAGSRNAPAAGDGAPRASQGAAPAKGQPGIVVEAAKVSVVKLPQSLTAVGSLRSDETIIVRPEVAGRVVQIGFKEGEPVAKGSVLLRLDGSVQQADLERTKANYVLSKTKYERAVELRKQGFISSQATDEAENTLRVAKADVELMQARLDKTTIVAPFAGTIGLRQVSIGDYVKEGQDMVNLESLDPLKVDFRIPEISHSLLKDGQTLQISLDALPDKVYDGRVYAINPLIDSNGRAIVIRAQVTNKDGKLRPGMFARVRLFTSGVKDTMVIPEESLFPVGDEKYVYKVVDNKALRQKVDIGQRREGRVEILSGLGAEDVVVTAGALKLREGASVTIANQGPSAAPVGKSDAPKTRG